MAEGNFHKFNPLEVRQVYQARDVKQALLGRQPKCLNFVFCICLFCSFSFPHFCVRFCVDVSWISFLPNDVLDERFLFMPANLEVHFLVL